MSSLSGVLLVFSLIMITSHASAELKATSNARIGSPQKNNTIRPAVRGVNYGEFFRDWHEWYATIVEKPFYLHVDDVFIGKLILSREIDWKSAPPPVSGTMMTRVTFGSSGVTVLPDTGRYNLGLGITTRMRNGLSFDT